MQYQGSQALAHPIDVIWNALLDPTVLQQCIAGCEKFDQVDATNYTSTVKVSIGPVTARFVSKMELAEATPPSGCTLKFSGQGGVAGFGKGEARVTLLALEAGGTQLDWVADAQVGGKLAQIGSRLIEGTVRKMSEDFFERFAGVLAGPAPAAEVVAPTPEATPAAEHETKSAARTAAPESSPSSATPLWFFGMALAVGALGLAVWFSR